MSILVSEPGFYNELENTFKKVLIIASSNVKFCIKWLACLQVLNSRVPAIIITFDKVITEY